MEELWRASGGAAPARVKMPDWKQYEGELAGGQFPLERYLGGSEEAAVYLTRFSAERAAIRLVRAGDPQAAGLVDRWNRAAALSHPHLAGIHAVGTCTLAGMPMALLVTQYGDENLGEVLRDRPLTTDETRDMLLPVAEALAYLHGQGLAHGHLKPSEILAVEDTVKISSDTISAGNPAADVQALGITLVQALTQRTPAAGPRGPDPAVDALPPPFREIARNCLHEDSSLRWPAAKVAAALRPSEPSVEAQPVARRMVWQYLAAAAVIITAAVLIAALVIHRATAPAPSPAATEEVSLKTAPAEPASDAQEAVPKPSPLPPNGNPRTPRGAAAEPAPRSAEPALSAASESLRGGAAGPVRSVPVSESDITRRVLPDIPSKARATVRGTATVVVRVTVDPAGNVTAARLERTVSNYFGKLALEAARQWKFASVEGGGPRSWILRFQIRRTATTVVPRRVNF